jgi:hypothetical protein
MLYFGQGQGRELKGALRHTMLNFIDKIPYAVLIPFAILMLLAPFYPVPHVVEKILMLKNGMLKKPIDIFDLFFHLIPAVLLLLKILKDHAR